MEKWKIPASKQRYSVDQNATSQATKLSAVRSIPVTNTPSNIAREAPQSAFQVQSPHASDAIGNALYDAYTREPGLPEDMAAMLRQLNGNDNQNRY
jgi:hypothetical protein